MRLLPALALAAFSSAVAADTPPAAVQAPATAATTAAAPETDKTENRKSRLKFRGADPTCACTCASGGTSEADIRKAQEAREREARPSRPGAGPE